MNAVLLVVGLCMFTYIVCNVGRPVTTNRMTPVLTVLVVSALSLLAWPWIGPTITVIFHLFSH